MISSRTVAVIASLALCTSIPAQTAALAEAFEAGGWTWRLERAYAEHSLADARERCGARVTAEFWDWLGRAPEVRDVVVWATVAAPAPKVFVCLDRLRTRHEAEVRRLPDLAVGFALAWSAGDGDEPRRRWESWTHGRGPIPSMERSFVWYAENERRLAFPVRRAHWELLAYTALNDVPLDERAWALARYRGKSPSELRDIFGQVPYVAGGLDGKPATLANMIEHGGVCTVNTQFQMAVMRTLGIPATFAGGPGHCWPCWFSGTSRATVFDRANDLGNADGTLGEWGVEGHRYESDLRLLARAVAQGAGKLRAADLTAAAYRTLGDAATPQAFDVLVQSLESNPYAMRAWRAFAERVATGRALPERAIAKLRSLAQILGEHPRAQLSILAAAIPAAPNPDVDRRSVDALVAACDRVGELEGFSTDARELVISLRARTGSVGEADRLRLELLRGAREEDEAPGRSRAVGGTGGGKFTARGPAGAQLVGFRYTTGDYSGHRVIASIQPLFRLGGRRVEGDTVGRANGAPREIEAREGFRVAGIEVRSGDVVDAFAVVFAPVDGDGVDLREVYFSEWAGDSGDGRGALLGGTGDPIVGIHGRSGALLDALGVLVERVRRR